MTVTTANKAARPLVIEAGAVLDGTNARARTDRSVLIVGDRIVAVDTPREIRQRPEAAAADVVEAPDATLLPGLIDGHLHIGWRTTTDVAPERNRDRLMAWML